MAIARFRNEVTVTVRDNDGKITRQFTQKNTIAYGSTAEHNGLIYTLMRLFNDDDSGNLPWDQASELGKMELGTGTPDNTGITPYPDSPATTFISFASKVWDYSTITAPKVTVTCTWGSEFDELSGITEVGLFTLVGDLFAYKTLPSLSKTTDGEIKIEWIVGLIAA